MAVRPRIDLDLPATVADIRKFIEVCDKLNVLADSEVRPVYYQRSPGDDSEISHLTVEVT